MARRKPTHPDSGTAHKNAMSIPEHDTIDPGNYGKNAPVIEPGEMRTSFALTEGEVKYVKALFDWLVEPCICFVRRELTEMAPTGDSQLLVGCLRVDPAHGAGP